MNFKHMFIHVSNDPFYCFSKKKKKKSNDPSLICNLFPFLLNFVFYFLLLQKCRATKWYKIVHNYFYNLVIVVWRSYHFDSCNFDQRSHIIIQIWLMTFFFLIILKIKIFAWQKIMHNIMWISQLQLGILAR